jgi:hypothetical protein
VTVRRCKYGKCHKYRKIRRHYGYIRKNGRRYSKRLYKRVVHRKRKCRTITKVRFVRRAKPLRKYRYVKIKHVIKHYKKKAHHEKRVIRKQRKIIKKLEKAPCVRRAMARRKTYKRGY